MRCLEGLEPEQALFALVIERVVGVPEQNFDTRAGPGRQR